MLKMFKKKTVLSSFINKNFTPLPLELLKPNEDLADKIINVLDDIHNKPKSATVRLSGFRFVNDKDSIYFFRAIALMEKIISSEMFFRKAMEIPFTDTTDSAEEIYYKILSGATVLQPEKDGVINLYVEVYYSRFTRVVGYTYPNTVWQWFNRKFFDRSEKGIITLAANLLHEYCHKCGYDHPNKRTWETSVPYAYGTLLENIATFTDLSTISAERI